MRKMNRFMAFALATLLVFSTLASDYMVASAEEIVEETSVVDDVDSSDDSVVEAPVWEEIPDEGTDVAAEDASQKEESNVSDDTAEEADGEETTEDTENVDITEETELVDEEALEEETARPAMVLEGSVSGIKVTVDAPEGALPEGTTLSVSSISAPQLEEQITSIEENRNREVVKFISLDVTLYDQDGNVIEPDESVRISFTNIESTDLEDGKIVAYHSENINATVERMAETSADNSNIEFSIDSLSAKV